MCGIAVCLRLLAPMTQHTSDFNRADVCGIIAHAAFESVVIVLTYIRITHIRQSLRSIGQESDGRSRLLWRHGTNQFKNPLLFNLINNSEQGSYTSCKH